MLAIQLHRLWSICDALATMAIQLREGCQEIIYQVLDSCHLLCHHLQRKRTAHQLNTYASQHLGMAETGCGNGRHQRSQVFQSLHAGNTVFTRCAALRTSHVCWWLAMSRLIFLISSSMLSSCLRVSSFDGSFMIWWRSICRRPRARQFNTDLSSADNQCPAASGSRRYCRTPEGKSNKSAEGCRSVQPRVPPAAHLILFLLLAPHLGLHQLLFLCLYQGFGLCCNRNAACEHKLHHEGNLQAHYPIAGKDNLQSS